jgi:hypothetical protein
MRATSENSTSQFLGTLVTLVAYIYTRIFAALLIARAKMTLNRPVCAKNICKKMLHLEE